MKKTLMIFTITAVIFLVTGCFDQTQAEKKEFKEYSIEDVLVFDFSTVSEIKMSIPYMIDEDNTSFEIKGVTETADKEKIYDFLAGISMKEIENVSEGVGFDGLIQIDIPDADETNDIYLVFLKKEVLINNKKFYESDKDLTESFLALYDSMDYEIEKMK